MKKELIIIGLGKMGKGLALNLLRKGWTVYGFNRTHSVTQEMEAHGLKGLSNFVEIEQIEGPKVVWTMLPAGNVTKEIIFGENGLSKYLKSGDTIVEGGNSLYKDDAENAAKLEPLGINYLDVGVSGGPYGAEHAACLMIGGKKENFLQHEELFKTLSSGTSYKFFEGYGAGHFVKMVHNGIEYGMMQSIAEGFNLFKSTKYNFNLKDIADIYSDGSIIQSKLVDCLVKGLEVFGEELNDVSGSVKSNGEAHWTVDAAKENNVEVKVIEESVKFRDQSLNNPSFTGKILSTLRNIFGGHDFK